MMKIIITVLLLVTLGAGAFFYISLDRGNGEQRESPGESLGSENSVRMDAEEDYVFERSEREEALAFQTGREEEAKEKLRSLHRTMNELTGYGRVETFRFEDLREGEYHDPEKLMNKAETLKNDYLDDSRAVDDVSNFMTFYDYASDPAVEDRMAMRYAHRIIHDLDYEVNGVEEGGDIQIYGVTEAYGNDDSLEELYGYLLDAGETL
ncbi:MAG: hypothetical protein EA344_12295 [Alkalicoccus sp.]|nr:MAG: hypothetical protein EA344_12295 [Alkalicoccus sp.]